MEESKIENLAKDPSGLIQQTNDIIQFLEKITKEHGKAKMINSVVDFLALMMLLKNVQFDEFTDFVESYVKNFQKY